MPNEALASPALSRLLAVRDLSDPSQGPHAVQLVLDAAVDALARAWASQIVVHRDSPLVAGDDVTAGGREVRPGRAAGVRLRARTAEMIPPLLQRIAAAPPDDVLLVCPGAVYPAPTPAPERAPVADASPEARRAHEWRRADVPHEVDLWRVRRGAPFGLRDVAQMIGPAAAAVAAGFTLSAVPAPMPDTVDARRIDVRLQGKWVEIGRCGIVDTGVLRRAGLPPDASAMAMTLDLDRLVMLAKGIADVALLRSRSAGAAAQMLDLEPYVPVEALAFTVREVELHPAAAAPRPPTLAAVRASIDDVDGRIVSLLAERRSYVVQAALFKRSPDDVRVPAREEQVIANVRAVAARAGIEPDLVEDLYRRMIERLVRVEMAEHPDARHRPARALPAPVAGACR